MRSREIPMTEAEFLRLPREFGWRYEYAGGVAHVRPRHLVGKLRAPVTPRPVPDTGCDIRPVTPDDAPGLARAFVDGFGDTVEYCDSTPAQIRLAAEDAVATFFAGRRGASHPASLLATPRSDPRTVAGTALLVRKPDGPFLDMLFVRERWQRSGLATALVGAAMNALHGAGETHLGSAYNVANAPSVRWHHKFGFEERPDAVLARARASAARYELWRRQEFGVSTDAATSALEAEADHWERLAIALEEQTFTRRAAARAQTQSSPA